MRLKPWVVDVTPGIQEPYLFPPAGRPLSLLQERLWPRCVVLGGLCAFTLKRCFREQPGAPTLKRTREQPTTEMH